MPEAQNRCVYIAPLDRVAELKGELTNIVFEKDNLFMATGAAQKPFWAQNIWANARVEKIESIKKAATFLKQIQRNWSHFPLTFVRRATLIQELLPKIKREPLNFPTALPTLPMGAFCLFSEHEMLYSPATSSPLSNGEYFFKEPSYKTPSQAYLKLWEALTHFGAVPKTGDFCLDLGSSPGSWTQALLALGAEVLSVDKAALEIAPSAQLQYLKKDAFKLDPASIKAPQWIFSDIICYPDKLLELALLWKSVHPQARYVFTLKFQGAWDPLAVAKFCQIPHSTVRHLYNNKNELCWISAPDTK